MRQLSLRIALVGASLSLMPGCLIASGVLLKICGDGVVNPDARQPEECDDGGFNGADDKCDDECKLIVNAGCGNQQLEANDFCFDDQNVEDIADANAQGDLVAKDLDNDGLPEAAYSLSGGAARVVQNLSNNGAFDSNNITFTVGSATINVFDAADIDGDGQLDLLTGDNDAAGAVFGDGNLIFDTFTELVFPVSNGNNVAPTSALVADINADGQADIVGTTEKSSGDGVFFVGEQEGGTPFTLSTSSFGDDLFGVVASGDFGFAIVASQLANNLIIIPNADVLGANLNAVATIGDSPVDLAVADINNDGDDDLVSANDTGVSFLLADSNGFSGSAVDVPIATGATSVALGKLDNDNFIDAVAASGTQILIIPGNGAGFAAPKVTVDAGAPISAVQIADFNGDGALDIAALTSNGLHIFIADF